MKTKLIGGMAFLTAVLLTASCARGVDEESFSAGVTNTQLESPTIDEASFSILTNPDGTESIKLAWPVVYGAGGYLCNVQCVENPEDESVTAENPLTVIQDSIIDGCSVAFAKIEDAVYNISVKTLGNDKLNNTDATEATTYQYSALVPATTIPAGSDIAEYINANLTNSDKEQGFALEAGQTYTLNSKVDFGLNQITLRSTEKGGIHPRIIVGAEGTLMTQAGLKIKFIDFDCTNATQTGLITLSDTPDASLSTESLGYKANGANQDGYVINKPVIFQECNIKNLPNSIIYGNKQPWSLRDFRITDCLIQMNNEGSNSFINLYNGKNGLIKDMTIENNTIWNIVKNGSAYFIRYSNSSNAQPKKIFGNNDNSSTHNIRYNTFCKTFSNKDFGNNMPNTNTVVLNTQYNIFYDVFRIYQYLQSNCTRHTPGNTIWGVDGGTPNGNDTGGRKDNDGNPYATLEDPQFVGPFLQEIDLDDTAKGGVNFTPTAPVATGNKAGDPRWY